MANEIIITVKTRNESKPGLDQSGRDVDTLRARAKALGEEFSRVSGQTDDFGKRLAGSGSYTEFLTVKIGKLKQEARALGDEFNRTGNTDLLGKIFDADKARKDIEKVKTEFTKAIGDGARDAEPGFLSTVRDLASKTNPLIAAAIAAGVAGAGPILLGAAGLTGIGIGIAGQIHSPAVIRAFQELGADASTTLHAVSSSFENVLVADAGKIDQAFTRIGPALKQGVDAVAPTFDHLITGVTGLVEKMTPGFVEGMKGGAVVLDQVAKDLPDVGRAVGGAFAAVAQDAQGGADAVHQILVSAEALVSVIAIVADEFEKLDILGNKLTFGHLTDLTIGPFAEALTATGDSARKTSNTLADFVFGPLTAYALKSKDAGSSTDDFAAALKKAQDEADATATATDLAGGKAMSASDQFGQLAASLGQVNNTADTVAGAMSDKLFGSLMSADEAALHLAKAQTKLSEELKKNKDALDIHTAAGQADRGAILAVVQANIASYDQMIKVGMSAQDAAAAYDANTAALENQLHKLGLAPQAIDALIGKYRAVPDTINTDIQMHGLTQALADLDETLRLVNHLNGRTITINEHVYSNVSPSQFFHGLATGGIVGAASGMVRGAGLTWVGEQGPELVRLPVGSQVMSNPDSQRQIASMQAPSSGSGGGPTQVQLVLDGSVLGTVLMRGLRTGQWYVPASAVVN